MPAGGLHVCKDTIADIETEPEKGLVKVAFEEQVAMAKSGRLELQRRFVELRARGWSLRRCAEAIGVSTTTLSTWQHDLEAEIAGLKAIELEALYEEVYLSKEARIRLLGDQIAALRQELATRDLSEVSTEKLLDLLLRWQEALAEEYVEPRPLSSRQVARLQAEPGPKLDSLQISAELGQTLERYRAGLVTMEEARQELALLLAMLKAEEQAELQLKLDSILAVLEARG